MANPAFVNPRLTPEQAEALAASFRPSWELDEPAGTLGSPDATLTDGDLARLHAQNGNGTLQNGRHASEPRMPPAPRQASEPEDSVIIDRSITASDLASRAAPPHLAPAAFPHPAPPATVPEAAPAGSRIAVAQTAAAPAVPALVPTVPPARAGAPRRSLPLDEDLSPPRSRKGLFLGLGAVGLVAIVGIAVVASKSGSDAPAATTTAAVKTEAPKPNIPPPPALTDTPASTAAAAATTAKPAPTTSPTPAKPEPAPKPDKPQRPVAAPQPPPNNDVPRPPPPRPPPARPAVPVKDVPF